MPGLITAAGTFGQHILKSVSGLYQIAFMGSPD